MVSSPYYSGEGRRYGGSRAGPMYHTNRRGNGYSNRESRAPPSGDRDGSSEPTPQRKRIAVACGRCRKRKIRCSGDVGQGACTNCRNAGYEPCQFLRVASQETCMRHEWNYGIESVRQYQARGTTAVAPHIATYAQYPESITLPSNDGQLSRQGLAHPYNARQYNPTSVGAWNNGYSDERGVGYGVYPPTYPPIQESEYGMGYRMMPSVGTRNSAVIMDSENNYAFSNGSSSSGLVHRPAPVSTPTPTTPSTPVVSIFSYQHATTGTTGTADRVLPAPIGRALLSSGGSSSRNDSNSSVYSRGSNTSTSCASPASPFSDVVPSYTSYESTPVAPSYPPTTLAMHMPRPSDSYPTPASSDGVFSPTVSAARTPITSVPEMTYRYTDATTRRASGSGTPFVHFSNGLSYVSHGSRSSSSNIMTSNHGLSQGGSFVVGTSDIDSGNEAETDSAGRKNAGHIRG